MQSKTQATYQAINTICQSQHNCALIRMRSVQYVDEQYCILYTLNSNELAKHADIIEQQLNVTNSDFLGTFSVYTLRDTLLTICYYTWQSNETDEWYDDIMREHIIDCINSI